MGAHSLAWGSNNVHDHDRRFQATRSIHKGRCRAFPIGGAQRLEDRHLGAVAPDPDRRQSEPITDPEVLFARGDDERVAQAESLEGSRREGPRRGEPLGAELLGEGLVAGQAFGAAVADPVHAAVADPGERDATLAQRERGCADTEGPSSPEPHVGVPKRLFRVGPELEQVAGDIPVEHEGRRLPDERPVFVGTIARCRPPRHRERAHGNVTAGKRAGWWKSGRGPGSGVAHR